MQSHSLREKLRGGLAFMRSCLPRKRRPLVVGWAVTKRCNYRCRYCRVWEEDRELNTDQALGLIDEIADAGTMVLGLTGGEPLVREDLGRLISQATSRGLAVYLSSNGALVQERYSEIRDIRRLTISIEGPEDINDSIRGPGSFDRAISAVRFAKSRSIPVRLATTINSANVHRIPEMLSLATGLAVKVFIQPAIVSQLGSRKPNPLQPGRDDYHTTMSELIRLRGRWSTSIIANSASGLRHLARWPDDKPVVCASGFLGCRIEPLGDVYHCARVQVRRPTQNALANGFAAAFQSLGPKRCTQCWCAQRTELSMLRSLKPDVLLNTLLST
ncbi:MAG TPA: radical SAM protein [Myxococcota bacterium]|nr:radical SAM protein [Myxococcota bacterium]